jgi:uncharacterized SAM-binding protein YcdF (DUF218 family)
MSPILCPEPLSLALTAVPSWLGPTTATAALLVVVLRAAVWSTVVLVGLLTRDKERARRARRMLECAWSPRQKRFR